MGIFIKKKNLKYISQTELHCDFNILLYDFILSSETCIGQTLIKVYSINTEVRFAGTLPGLLRSFLNRHICGRLNSLAAPVLGTDHTLSGSRDTPAPMMLCCKF